MKVGISILASDNIESYHKSIISLFFLYQNGIINDQSLNSRVAQLKSGKFDEIRKSYDDKQTKTSHSNKNMHDILVIISTKKCDTRQYDISDLIRFYIRIISRNRNYAIDVVYDKVIRPVCDISDKRYEEYFGISQYKTILELNEYINDYLLSFRNNFKTNPREFRPFIGLIY